MPRETIDQLDRKILISLESTSRQVLSDLANRLKISKQLLSYRLKNLQKNGVITHYYAVIDTHRLGCITFRIYFRLRRISFKDQKDIIRYFSELNTTLWVVKTDGAWDLEVVFTVRNSIHLNNVFKKSLLELGRFFDKYNISMSPVTYHFKRDYLISDTRKDFAISFYGNEPTIKAWDKIDFEILNELAHDAQQGSEEIARKLKLSYKTIIRRIERLESEKVIQGYRPAVNSLILARSYFKACISLAPIDRQMTTRLYKFIASFSFVIYLTEVLGDWQLEIETEVTDRQVLYELLREIRNKFPDIILDFETIEVIKQHKLDYFPFKKTAYTELITNRESPPKEYNFPEGHR